MVKKFMSSILAEDWQSFPPTREDGHRIQIYDNLEKYVRPPQEVIFGGIKPGEGGVPKTWDKEKRYLSLNFSHILCSLSSDMLFGESPAFRVENDEDGYFVDLLDRMQFDTLCQEIAYCGAYRGDAVLKARFDAKKGTVIEAVDPAMFFPEFDCNNNKSMSRCVLAWVIVPDPLKPQETFLRQEIHSPGLIENKLYRLQGSIIEAQVPFAPESGIVEFEETLIDDIPIVHIPNWRLDSSYWGISDLWDIVPLQEELSGRISNISSILDKHSSPKLLLPAGAMHWDEKYQSWVLKKEVAEVLELEPDVEGDLPRYLVWDAKLEAAFQELDLLLNYMTMIAEVSGLSIGLDSGGNFPESGRALKYRLIRTYFKMRRKQRYFDSRLKKILYIAQQFEHLFGGGKKPQDVKIEWKDALPDDQKEIVEIVAAGVNAKIMSRRRGVILQGVENVDEEIEEIEKEEEEQNEKYLLDFSSRPAGFREPSTKNGGEGKTNEKMASSTQRKN